VSIPQRGFLFLQVSGLNSPTPRRVIFDRVTDIRLGSEEEGYALWIIRIQ